MTDQTWQLYSDKRRYEQPQAGDPTDLGLVAWVYLHGLLETRIGFDIVHSTVSAETLLGNQGSRVLPAQINDVGDSFAAQAFLWRAPKTAMIRGLIVAPDDQSALDYAMGVMINRAERL